MRTTNVRVKGTSVPVTLDVTHMGRQIFPMDNTEHIGFVAGGVVSRSAFGVGSQIPSFRLSDDIKLDLAVQLIAE